MRAACSPALTNSLSLPALPAVSLLRSSSCWSSLSKTTATRRARPTPPPFRSVLRTGAQRGRCLVRATCVSFLRALFRSRHPASISTVHSLTLRSERRRACAFPDPNSPRGSSAGGVTTPGPIILRRTSRGTGCPVPPDDPGLEIGTASTQRGIEALQAPPRLDGSSERVAPAKVECFGSATKPKGRAYEAGSEEHAAARQEGAESKRDMRLLRHPSWQRRQDPTKEHGSRREKREKFGRISLPMAPRGAGVQATNPRGVLYPGPPRCRLTHQQTLGTGLRGPE